MIFPDQAVRIMIATKPVDFRKGHDGLASMAQAELGFVPKVGVMVVFRSKRGDRIKVLFWDGSGIVMIYKRLEQGGFAWPKVGDGVMRLSRVQFEALFAGLDWRRIHAPRLFIIALLGGFSGRFGGYGYGFGHGGVGVLGTILIIIVILMLLGRI